MRDHWVESNQAMGVDIFIPEFAEPGPRGIFILASLGENEPFTAVLEQGFHVMQGEPEVPPPFEPPEQPAEDWQEGSSDNDPTIILILILILGGLGLGVALVTVLLVRNAALKQGWQQQAQSQELPEKCHSSTYLNRREGLEIKPGRWKLAGLQVTLYDSQRNQAGEVRSVPADLAGKLDHAARYRLMSGDNDELRSQIRELARELHALITAWRSVSRHGRDVFLQAKLEGGSAEAKFARYHCVGQPGKWQKVLEWKAKAQGGRAFTGHLQGTPGG